MSEPAGELSVQELGASPAVDDALDSVANGRVVQLVSHGNLVAAIVPAGMLEELEETVAFLSDSDAVRSLVEAREAADRGDVVRGS